MTARQAQCGTRSGIPDRCCKLDGGAPIALPPDHRVWLVTAGRVEVFMEHSKGRSFLSSLDAGEHLFGPANLARGTLLVAGPAGSSLEAVDPAALDVEDLASDADRWIAAAARPFGDVTPSDGEAVRLQAGGRSAPKPGSVLRASKDSVWVNIPAAGRVRLGGSDLVVEGPASIPIAGDLSVEVLEASAVWTDSSAALAGGHPTLKVPGRIAIAHHLIRAWLDDETGLA